MKDEKQENNAQPTAITGMPMDERAAFIEAMSRGVAKEMDELLAVSVDPNRMEVDLLLAMAAVSACRASILTARLHEIRRTQRLELMAGTQKEIEQQLFDLVEADEKPAEEKHEAETVTDVTP